MSAYEERKKHHVLPAGAMYPFCSSSPHTGPGLWQVDTLSFDPGTMTADFRRVPPKEAYRKKFHYSFSVEHASEGLLASLSSFERERGVPHGSYSGKPDGVERLLAGHELEMIPALVRLGRGEGVVEDRDRILGFMALQVVRSTYMVDSLIEIYGKPGMSDAAVKVAALEQMLFYARVMFTKFRYGTLKVIPAANATLVPSVWSIPFITSDKAVSFFTLAGLEAMFMPVSPSRGVLALATDRHSGFFELDDQGCLTSYDMGSVRNGVGNGSWTQLTATRCNLATWNNARFAFSPLPYLYLQDPSSHAARHVLIRPRQEDV